MVVTSSGTLPQRVGIFTPDTNDNSGKTDIDNQAEQKRIDAVTDIDKLFSYLQQEYNKRDRLYHYTTLEALLHILKNKCFRLTRLDLLNDKKEKELGQFDNNAVDYIMSFSTKKEYISMWAMYGNPSGIKLRLDFDRKLFKTSRRDLFCDMSNENPIFVENEVPKKNFFMLIKDMNQDSMFITKSDIVYFDKEDKTIRHKTHTFRMLDYESLSEEQLKAIKGLRKYDAWEFENEIRLRVRLNKENFKAALNPMQDFPEYIYLKINQNLINSFRICYNPCLSQEMKKHVKNSLKNAAGVELDCYDSELDGEVDERILE